MPQSRVCPAAGPALSPGSVLGSTMSLQEFGVGLGVGAESRVPCSVGKQVHSPQKPKPRASLHLPFWGKQPPRSRPGPDGSGRGSSLPVSPASQGF